MKLILSGKALPSVWLEPSVPAGECCGKRLGQVLSIELMGVGSRVSFEALGLGLAYCGSSADAL